MIDVLLLHSYIAINFTDFRVSEKSGHSGTRTPHLFFAGGLPNPRASHSLWLEVHFFQKF